MTDEERQKLCDALRGERSWPGALAKLMPDAADEIERLAAENKKLRDDAEWDRHVEGCRARKHYK
jgi:hypothetical protein